MCPRISKEFLLSLYLAFMVGTGCSSQTVQTVAIDEMEDMSLWKPGDPGARVTAEKKLVKQGKQSLRFQIKVDHTTGTVIGGRTYLKSWPKAQRDFTPPLNLSMVDGIAFDIHATASRESMGNAPINVSLRDDVGGTFQEALSVPLNTWTRIKIPLGTFPRTRISYIQFYVGEDSYKHEDTISFIFDNLSGYIENPGQEARESLQHTAETLQQLKALDMDSDVCQILRVQRRDLEDRCKKVSWQDLRQAAEFTEQCGTLQRKVAAELLRQRSRAAFPDRPYAVGVETPLRKVFRDDLDYPPGNEISMTLAGNERESAQILLHPFEQDIQSVAAVCGELIGPEGAVIPADKISIHAVGYIEMPPPGYVVDRGGWWPDPLLPMDWPGSGKKGLGPLAERFVQKGQTHPLWVTVRCPADTPAGEYRGTITLSPKNLPETKIVLRVKVRNFSLPTRPRLKTSFSSSPETWAAFGRFSLEGRDDLRQKLYNFLLEHKLNPMGLYAPYSTPPVKEAEYLYARGLNAFSLGYCPPGEDEFGNRVYYRWIRDQREYLTRKGLGGLAWVYGWDEPDCRPGFESRVRQMERIFGGYLEDVAPGLPRGCTVPIEPVLNGLVTLWVPATNKYNPSDAQARRAAGDHVWTYIANNPRHPYANIFIDYPAIEHRVVLWQAWQLGATGFLYYATISWSPNIVDGPRWPEIPWQPRPMTNGRNNFNGDGTLFYPGSGTDLLSSQRLEVITDGIEDYDYFSLLKEAAQELRKSPKADQDLIAQADALTHIPKTISAGMTEYTSDPSELLKYRDTMGEVIERLRLALPEDVWQRLMEKCPPLATPLRYTPSTQVESVPFEGIQRRKMQPQANRHNEARTNYVERDGDCLAVSCAAGKGWSDWESPLWSTTSKRISGAARSTVHRLPLRWNSIIVFVRKSGRMTRGRFSAAMYFVVERTSRSGSEAKSAWDSSMSMKNCFLRSIRKLRAWRPCPSGRVGFAGRNLTAECSGSSPELSIRRFVMPPGNT